MDYTQQFFIDTIKLVPISDKSVLFVQAPYEQLIVFFNKLSSKNDGVNEVIVLNKKNISLLLFEVIYNDFESYLQNIEIKVNGIKIFEGYDGMEYGMFSKNYIIPKDFELNYKDKNMYLISNEW